MSLVEIHKHVTVGKPVLEKRQRKLQHEKLLMACSSTLGCMLDAIDVALVDLYNLQRECKQKQTSNARGEAERTRCDIGLGREKDKTVLMRQGNG